jgi:hypothetical protein
MTENNTPENVVNLAEAAQKRGKFNLADTIKGRGYPEASVDVYLDSGSAFELEQVNQKLQELSNLGQLEDYDKLNIVARELADKIEESKLTFHMRGVGQAIVEDAVKNADKLAPNVDGEDNPEWVKFYLSYLIAANVTKVTDAEGNEDTSKFSMEDMIEIRGIIPVDSWGNLVETMQKLTLAGSYFEAVTDAGFLPKS